MQNVHEILISRCKLEQLITERLDYLPQLPNHPPHELAFDAEMVETILEFYEGRQDALFENTHRFTADRLLTYLKATHRYYLDKMLPEIEQSVLHVFTLYRQSDRLLSALVLFFNEYKKELVQHILQEENTFFPHVEKLLDAQKGTLPLCEAENLLKASPLERFAEHHDAVEDRLEEVRTIILNHSPEGALPFAYRIFLTQVDIFAMELEKHGIIEDVLFLPMVQQLELKLARKN